MTFILKDQVTVYSNISIVLDC